MHGSTLLPWLLIGPILVATLGRIVAGITGWPWLDVVWKSALVIAIGVILIAFTGNFLSQLAIEKAAKRANDETR